MLCLCIWHSMHFAWPFTLLRAECWGPSGSPPPQASPGEWQSEALGHPTTGVLSPCVFCFDSWPPLVNVSSIFCCLVLMCRHAWRWACISSGAACARRPCEGGFRMCNPCFSQLLLAIWRGETYEILGQVRRRWWSLLDFFFFFCGIFMNLSLRPPYLT